VIDHKSPAQSNSTTLPSHIAETVDAVAQIRTAEIAFDLQSQQMDAHHRHDRGDLRVTTGLDERVVEMDALSEQ